MLFKNLMTLIILELQLYHVEAWIRMPIWLYTQNISSFQEHKQVSIIDSHYRPDLHLA